MESQQSTDEWEITTDRYVAFFDIMGFKDMVARSSHDDIYQMMTKIDEVKKTNESIRWGGHEELLVKSTFFSDSIILYTKDNSLNSAYAITATVSSITFDLLNSGIPHKGALAFGKMTVDTVNSIFFGQPLIDAYLLQEEINLYCIVVHSSAENEIYSKNYRPKVIADDYQCPFKGGTSVHLTIPPIFIYATDEATLGRFNEMTDGVKKLRYKTSGHIRKYVDNTETYINTMRDLFLNSDKYKSGNF